MTTPASTVADQAAFEIGLQLFAQLLEEARDHKNDGQLSAHHRGRGIPQNAFAKTPLQRAFSDSGIFVGFVSGLSGYLAAWANGEQITPEDVRQTTWSDVHGGPATIYWDEVVPTSKPKDPPVASGSASGAAEPQAENADDNTSPSWREVVAGLIEKVEGLIGSAAAHTALDGSRHGGLARGLLYLAQQRLDRHAHLLASGDPDDYYGECILWVQADIVGARYMPETAPGFGEVLAPACDILEQVATLLDDASVGPKAPPLITPGPDSIAIEWFMAGKSLCADLVEKAIAIENAGSDEADLEARFRGRGVPQNDFAREYLEEVIDTPELLAGFSAALSNTLRCAGTANDSPANMRKLTYEEYVGGPDTVYSEEEDAALPAETIFTDPVEIAFDTILNRIDTYLEGLEHVGIGDEAHGVLHSDALGHFWEAREALIQHAPSGTVMHHLRQLRDGLTKLEEEMGSENVGLPLVQACLKPLNMVLRRTAEDAEITSERVEVAVAAGRFISRMAAYFRSTDADVQQQDWEAIHTAASVVISLQDPTDDVPELEARLGYAIEMASVIFQEQPPQSWAEGRIVRQEHVGKRLVEAVH